LHDLVADVGAEMPPNERRRGVSASEPRDARVTRILRRNIFGFAPNYVDRDFNHEFLLAGLRFHGSSLRDFNVNQNDEVSISRDH
jgi:hypothetical protein